MVNAARDQVERAAERWRQRRDCRAARMAAIGRGRLVAAGGRERVAARLARLDARAGRRGDVDLSGQPVTERRAQAAILRSCDLLSIEFLEAGLRAAAAVGLVVTMGERNATGFLVGQGLMLTNHHVLPDAEVAAASVLELDHEDNRVGAAKPVETFRLLPERLFLADSELDIALVAVAARSAKRVPLTGYGCLPLIAAQGKVVPGECVNIVQHPGGMTKRVVVRNNCVVDLSDEPGMDAYLHYLAQTEAGSSGSPVLNDQWEVVAVHHAAIGPVDRAGRLADCRARKHVPRAPTANEGIRVSRIVSRLGVLAAGDDERAAVLRPLLAAWDRTG